MHPRHLPDQHLRVENLVSPRTKNKEELTIEGAGGLTRDKSDRGTGLHGCQTWARLYSPLARALCCISNKEAWCHLLMRCLGKAALPLSSLAIGIDGPIFCESSIACDFGLRDQG
jgi:hypothetical protein